jgi:cell division septum initiation protein DivIVA
MRRITLVAAVLVLGLAGCGGKEKEELRQKVANLEQQLAKAVSQVAESEAAIASMETSIKQARDETAKCKADIAQLNKKKTVTRKK